MKQQDVLDRFELFISKIPSHDQIDLIRKAFSLACEIYGNKQHEWGVSYMHHSLDVAEICLDQLDLRSTAIVCVFLNQAALDGSLDVSKLSSDFTPKVAEIIEGLCKINSLDSIEDGGQAENFRKFVLNLAKDMRVILIKLADILNIMLKMESLPEERRIKIASDASFLYAPLAHRLGLYMVKQEMENLSLKYLNPEDYSDIANKLKATDKAREKFIADFISPIQKKLDDHGFKCEIKGRPKSIFSIWNKMTTKDVSFEDVYDKFAIRVIIDCSMENEKAECWRAYSLITETYQPNPYRLRDWISFPKSNGYESLHTTVVVPGGQWVEVQIRTVRMNEIAEKGFAAHWRYKENNQEANNGIDDWLGKIREFIEAPQDGSEEMVDQFKLSLYSKEIFVFTPRGDLKNLPMGSTVLDFAYEIHSDIGDKCAGANVNGRNVPIRYVLQNGEKVSILTSSSQKPKTDWLSFVITSKAKNRVRQALKEERLQEAENGKELVKRRFKNWKIEYSDTKINKLLKHYKVKTAIDLYYDIATERIDILEVKDVLLKNDQDHPEINKPKNQADNSYQDHFKTDDFLVIDERLNNVDYSLAPCCNPIFGDEVFGFVKINEGIKIHRLSCPNAKEMITRFGYRIVKARWSGGEGQAYFIANLRIVGVEEMGIISQISEIITKDFQTSLRNISIDTRDGIFEGKLKVMVNSKSHLEGLIKRLRSLKGVNSVSRQED